MKKVPSCNDVRYLEAHVCLLQPHSFGASSADLCAHALQVRELFELPENEAFQPATRRQMAAALLAGLRDAHWAAATGSRPEPALLLPLTPATALAGPQRPLAPFALARALAAAERRCIVLPQEGDHLSRLPSWCAWECLRISGFVHFCTHFSAPGRAIAAPCCSALGLDHPALKNSPLYCSRS